METVKALSFIDILLPLVVVVFIIGGGVVLLYLHFQKNLMAQRIKQDALRSAHQQELLRANIQAQEQERKRIAQDLHDELGSMLSIMRMNLVLLEQQATGTEGLVAGLQNTRRLSETALASVRGISHQLMPPQLEAFGLIKTLEAVTEQIGSSEQMCIELTVEAPLPLLSWSISIGLYRVIMELMNNTLKHAEASFITIHFAVADGWVICQYADNGRGFVAGEAGMGLGLKSIEGRINSLGGKLDMRNGAKDGFYAVIEIPVGVNS